MRTTPGTGPRRPALAAAAALLALLGGWPAEAGDSFSSSPSAPSWSNADSPAAGEVQAVGGAAGVLIASPATGPALRSTDAGLHWAAIAGFPPVTRGRVAFDPADPARGYVAGFGGVARTEDGGVTWTRVLDVARAARLDLDRHGRVLVGARFADASNHLLLSADHGATWQELAAPFPPEVPICGVAFGIAPGNLLIQTDQRSWYTTDLGATWTETPDAGFDFAMEDTGVVWRADQLGLERSTDGGATWVPLDPPGFGTAIGPRRGGGVWLASTAGLLETADGATWTNHGHLAAMLGTHGLAPDPTEPGVVWATDARRGIARLAPDGAGGLAFEGRTRGLPATAIDVLGGSADDAVLLAAGPVGLFASRDGGADWRHTGAGLGYAALRAVAAAPGGAAAYVGGRTMLGEPVVEAAGPTLRFQATVLPGLGEVVGLAAPAAGQAFAAVRRGAGGGTVYHTGDGGATWASLLDVPVGLTDAAWHAPERALLVGTEAGLLGFADGAWTLRSGPWARHVASDGAQVIAEGLGGGLWRSVAAGAPLPWTTGPGAVADVDARGSDAWAADAAGAVWRCAGPAGASCAVAGPPAVSTAVHRGAWRVLAGSGVGVWSVPAP